MNTQTFSREGDDGLVAVVVGGGDVDEHERLGVAAERVLHEHGQLVVAVGDELLLAAQRRDHVAQRRQRLVDGHGFLGSQTQSILSHVVTGELT